ncbi:hypothetical protein TrVFT333_000097 [Trichoderma virens FT-333]|nr:hypothetical protein TrVFT333_000097 [Trichoderma virens FT-333]
MVSSIVSTFHFESYPRLSPSKLRDEFKGKSVLITGGGYGIGASIARSFAEAGVASIILAGRTESSLKSTVDDLAQSLPSLRVSYRLVDISSASSVKDLFASLSESPDTLVNNAGFMSEPQNFVTADIAEWWKSFEINVLGTTIVTQAYLQHRMTREPKLPGVVIGLNTFASFAVRAPHLWAYSGSKIALARIFEMATAMYHKSGLEGSTDMPTTDSKLSAEFIVWATSQEAEFLSGRLAWANWDVDELIAKKTEIVGKDLLISGLTVV